MDATAGFGLDAYEMACLGCRVTLVERIPEMAQALARGLALAWQTVPDSHPVHRMNLVEADAIDWLSRLQAPRPEVVYIDPMYPQRRKAALGKGSLRRLRELAGDDPDAPQLLATALAITERRVTVKRPLRGERLAGPPPTLTVRGRTTRYDVYLVDDGNLQAPC